MLYSFFEAALAFIGVMLGCWNYGDGVRLRWAAWMAQAAAEHPTMVQLGYLCAFLGFGVKKAAVFPVPRMAAGGPSRRPVTALLHAVAVVKSGVFAIIRVTYFSFGAQVLRGTRRRSYRAVKLASVTMVYGSTMAAKGGSLQAPPGVFHRVEPVLSCWRRA